MRPFPLYLQDVDLNLFDVFPVTPKSLHDFYDTPNANMYVWEELAEGFTEDEIIEAYKNGRSVVAVVRKEE